jgi:hypothetical protein
VSISLEEVESMTKSATASAIAGRGTLAANEYIGQIYQF